MARKTLTGVGQDDTIKPLGFDDYDLKLGDMLRGERATLGKSLLEVQRELRISATYIAAIEACDPSAFDTPYGIWLVFVLAPILSVLRSFQGWRHWFLLISLCASC